MTTIAAVTIALWFTIGLIETSARPGGVVFRVLAVVLVVAVALLLPGLPRRSGRPGAGGTRRQDRSGDDARCGRVGGGGRPRSHPAAPAPEPALGAAG